MGDMLDHTPRNAGIVLESSAHEKGRFAAGLRTLTATQSFGLHCNLLQVADTTIRIGVTGPANCRILRLQGGVGNTEALLKDQSHLRQHAFPVSHGFQLDMRGQCMVA